MTRDRRRLPARESLMRAAASIAKEEFNDVGAGVSYGAQCPVRSPITDATLSQIRDRYSPARFHLVPENLTGMGEQEPNPVHRHRNQDGRKEQAG